MVPPINATKVPSSLTSSAKGLPSDAQSITVYKVVQTGGTSWSTNPKNGYYSPSENCIYVSEGSRANQPYTVTENRAYGQLNDGRSEYRYTAGGYFFNL